MNKIIISLVCCFLAAFTLGAADKNMVELADSAYTADDFGMAVACYEQALANEGTSSQLYYNLGNALYRDGKLGRAVIAYERALKIDPSNDDARFNLEFVKSHLVDKPVSTATTLEMITNSLVSWFSPNAWAWIACALFLSFLGLLAVYLFTTPVPLRKTGFFGSIIALILSVGAFIVAETAAARTTRHDECIVTSTSVVLCSAPRVPKDRNEEIALIHEGTKLNVLDSLINRTDSVQSKWYKVELDRRHQGWVPAPNIEII